MSDFGDDNRILDYLRNRAAVHVPDDLGERARSAGRRSARRQRPTAGGALLAGASLVVLVAAVVFAMNANSPSVASRPSASPTQTPAESAFPQIGPPFPASVLGMPVITVAEASHLAAKGQLDGRDVAIGGYFSDFAPSCPAIGGYQGPLWDFCRIAAFSDTAAGATVCHPTDGNGVACTGGVLPGELVPMFVPDSLGQSVPQSGLAPVPIVVLAHTSDPRWLQCFAAEAERCRQKLVVDRLAWVDGANTTPTPAAFDGSTYKNLTPSMTLDEIQSLLGGAQILSAAATTADGVRTVDPRWNMTGNRVDWVVRTVAATAAADGGDPTSAVTVSLIDDGTGQLVDQLPLALPDGYNFSRLWITEVRQGVTDWNSENSTASFYSVDGEVAPVVVDGILRGGGGSDSTMVNGPGLPLIIQPGTYELTAWLGPWASESAGASPFGSPIGECTTQHTFAAGDDVLLTATYQQHQTCSWSDGAKPSFGP